jgi:parvulin-like peptidyl-prolyl isomerase
MRARLLLPVAVVAVLLVALAGCGGGGSAAKLNSDDVATVGTIHISKTRFDDQLKLAEATLKSQGQTFPKAGTTEYEAIRAQALALLVQGAARELEAEKLGITVTDKDVEKQLATLKKNFKLNEKQYKAQLEQQGLTDAEVHAQIRTQLISQQVADKVTKDLKVSNAEVHKFYVANTAQYTTPSRDVLEILVGKNKKALAQQLYEQIKAGADFGKLAKKYSQDPGSKDKGGKFTAQQGKDVAEFDRVAFSLKTGELGKPVETPEYGWFIIKALTATKSVKQPESAVAEDIRNQLLQEKKNEALTVWLTDVAKEVCNGGEISYQVGYTPNPDPCAQYTATTPTTTTG